MDPLERVKAYKDTSYFLMLAADQRGHEVFSLNAVDLALDHDRVMGSLQRLHVNDDVDNPFAVEPARWQALDEMDVVWIRTDPPAGPSGSKLHPFHPTPAISHYRQQTDCRHRH